MSCASALGAAEPAASPSGAVKTRGAMARRPLIDHSALIHHGSHAWVEHVATSAARQTTSLVD